MGRWQFRRWSLVSQGLIQLCSGDRVCQVEGWLVSGTRSFGMFWLFTRATSWCQDLDSFAGVQVDGSLSATFGGMVLHILGVDHVGVAHRALSRALLQTAWLWSSHRAVNAWLDALRLAPLIDVLPRRGRIEPATTVKSVIPAGIILHFEYCIWQRARMRRRLPLRSHGVLRIVLPVAVPLAAHPLLSRQLGGQLAPLALIRLFLLQGDLRQLLLPMALSLGVVQRLHDPLSPSRAPVCSEQILAALCLQLQVHFVL